MNKFFIFLALVFLFNKASVAQNLKNFTFKSLGHEETIIYGLSGSSSFYFKISPLVDVKGSKIVLIFGISQSLVKEHSYLNVIIAGKPIYSTPVSKDSIQRVSLDLTPDQLTSDRYLKIQVKTSLSISDNNCDDIDNSGMWVTIKNNSYLSLIVNNRNIEHAVNIANCFDSKKAIVYPVDPGIKDLKAVAWAYARLKKTENNDIKVFEADKLPDSVKNYIMVGNLAALPVDLRTLIRVSPQPGEGLLYLSKSLVPVTDTVASMVNENNKLVAHKTVVHETVPAEILFITGGDDAGYEKSITAMGNINILNSTFGDYLLIDQAINSYFKNVDQNRSKLSLRQVGGESDFLSGVGSLKSGFNFKNSDFSFTPKEVEISFVGIYSGLAPGDRGYFNVYLNGLLISSDKLDASGKLNTSITISRYQHHKYNTLVAEFRFFPQTNGGCKNAFKNFFGEIDVDKSYLESKNPFITGDLSFYQYPEAFNTGTTRIVLSRKYAKYTAGAIGEIIYELNNNINANNFPDFVYSDQVPSSDLKKYNIIALLDKSDPLLNEFPDAPIKFDRDFRLYNAENNKKVYALSDTVSSGLAQIFYGRNNNATLVLIGTGIHMADGYLAASKSITEQLSTLSSNVCITDANSNKYLFNMNKSSENLEYVDTKSGLTHFWDSYNLYILLLILILIFLSFLYVRSKVQRSQGLFNE